MAYDLGEAAYLHYRKTMLQKCLQDYEIERECSEDTWIEIIVDLSSIAVRLKEFLNSPETL